MQILIFLISLTLATYILWPLFTDRENPRLVNFLPVVAAILVGAHLIFDGYRWQMIPLYALVGIILLTALLELRNPTTSEIERRSTFDFRNIAEIGLIGIFIVFSTALPVLLPVPTLPTPDGKYPVGTQTFVLTDKSRRELYTSKDEPRKFIIQVWYPANPGPNEQHAPWMDHTTIYARAISSHLGFPRFFLDYLTLLKSPAWQDAPVEPPTNLYPIILFSHDWNGYAAQNSVQALQLASRGNIVVAIQYTYGAAVTVFPDGKTIYNYPLAFLQNNIGTEYTEAARKLMNQWTGDIAFTLDYMTTKNQDPASPFFSSIDFTKVGVYGYSVGGAAAIQFCSIDTRCKAVLAMDPYMKPVSEQVLETGLSQPSLFMFSQEWMDDQESENNRLFKQFYRNFAPPSHVIGIQGTTHNDFTDLPTLIPLAYQLGLKGPIDSKRVAKIIDAYTYTFFIQSLNDYSDDLLNQTSDYPEVINLDYLTQGIRPIRLTLPGGQVFELGTGKIKRGKWQPLRAEWLEGTEISRWVALPQRYDLEATVQALNAGDQIKLTMINSDILTYRIDSIHKMTMDELLASNPTKPSLLVVVYNNKDADGTFWVIEALP